MKKTIAAILIIAMLAIAIALPSFAADTIYFTSVNNILMQLSDDTMPINYNGSIYVPYSVFNSHELGTFAVYSQSAQIITVFGNGVQLYFNLQDGTTYDTYDTQYRQRAISSNGRIYLPVAFTCEYFGINYSVISGNKYGNIVRMTVGDALDDATFSSAASALMKSRLDDYNKSKATSTPTASPTPTLTPTPVRTPSGGSSDTPDRSDINIYLSFFGIDPIHTPRILSLLQTRSNSAAFFVTPEEISAYPDIIRRINGSGHIIGIICGSDIEADYASAASLLYDAARTCSFIIATSSNYVIFDEASEQLGLIYYCSSSDAVDLKLDSALRTLKKAEERVDFIFNSSEKTADDLASLLRTLRSENYNIARLSELRAAEYADME